MHRARAVMTCCAGAATFMLDEFIVSVQYGRITGAMVVRTVTAPHSPYSTHRPSRFESLRLTADSPILELTRWVEGTCSYVGTRSYVYQPL